MGGMTEPRRLPRPTGRGGPDTGRPATRRAPERPLHDPRGPVPGDGARVAGSGRRADLGDPLRRTPRAHGAARSEARSWSHGVFLGATMASETTAAASGAVGELRRDPFAMLPFCGYHMGDYLTHWLHVGESGEADALPRIFQVNWFRRDDEGRFLWPGFGENARVLAWIHGRCEGTAEAVETPIGLVPAAGELDTRGLDVSDAALAALLEVDAAAWRAEVPLVEEHLAQFGDRLPGACVRSSTSSARDSPRASRRPRASGLPTSSAWRRRRRSRVERHRRSVAARVQRRSVGAERERPERTGTERRCGRKRVHGDRDDPRRPREVHRRPSAPSAAAAAPDELDCVPSEALRASLNVFRSITPTKPVRAFARYMDLSRVATPQDDGSAGRRGPPSEDRCRTPMRLVVISAWTNGTPDGRR